MKIEIKMPQKMELTKKHVFGFIVIVLLAFGYEKMGSETLTLYAYYPSPVGIYTRLVSINKATFGRDKGDVVLIGDTNADGQVVIGTKLRNSLPSFNYYRLYVKGRTNITGDTKIDGQLEVAGNSTFGGDIFATGKTLYIGRICLNGTDPTVCKEVWPTGGTTAPGGGTPTQQYLCPRVTESACGPSQCDGQVMSTPTCNVYMDDGNGNCYIASVVVCGPI